MRKTLLVIGAAAAGAGLAYLFDPDRGRSRRAQLSQQAKSQVREAAGTVRAKADYQAGVARGAIHEVADLVRAERSYDDETLIQKVRSEALGQFSSPESVEVEVSDGTVRISGSVQSEKARAQLMEMIENVEGVDSIEDSLQVTSGS